MRVLMAMALVLASSGVAEARFLVGKGIKGGVVGGVVQQEELGGTDPLDHLRLGAGVFLHFRGKSWGNFSIDAQAELMLSWKGGRVPEEPGQQHYDLNLFYVELPLLVRIGLARHVWLLAGPMVSYYAGGFLNGSGTFSSDQNGESQDNVDYPAQRVSGGFVSGLGFSTGAERGLGVELRYTLASDVAGYGDFKGLQTFCLLVGYEFE
jgi:hypothetical protein